MKTKVLSNQTKSTPGIVLKNDVLNISGDSYPFEAELFWSLIIHEVKSFKDVILEIDLNYINSNSIQYLTILSRLNNVGQVIWFYSDEDDLDIAKTIESISGQKFEMIQRNTVLEKYLVCD